MRRKPWSEPKEPQTLRIAFALMPQGDAAVNTTARSAVSVPCGSVAGSITFAFVGATKPVLKATFQWLCNGGNAAEGFTLRGSHSPQHRNGRAYYRHTVTLTGHNARFCSTEDLCTLICARLEADGHSVKLVKDYATLINL